jgi:hypothetical protein
VLDAQHGSQAMARDVLRWIDTKDFERVVVWAGFELEQGRIAAKYLRELCAEKSSTAAKPAIRPVVQVELDDVALTDEGEPFDDSLLALICTARDISQAKKASCPRESRRPMFRGSGAIASSAPA